MDKFGNSLADPMPQSYIGRWILYLDQIDAGRLSRQSSYHCWCEECFRAKYEANEDTNYVELLATNTGQVRGFIQRHEGHDLELMIDGEQEFADLEPRARNILLREAIYRRVWVATMNDQALKELPGVGPKILRDIRRQIPYGGPPQAGQAGADGTMLKLERCPTCYGTGLKLEDAALSTVAQRVADIESADAAAQATAPEPVLSMEESLTRLTKAVEDINSRLAVLQKDREEGLTTPRMVMSIYDAAKAVGMRYSELWDDVREGHLPFVRMVKGCPMISSGALQEWLKWHHEIRLQPKLEPITYTPPPERLCSRCGEREYHYYSGKLKVCRQCHEQVKEQRTNEKERKRAEHLSRKQRSDQP